MVDVVVWSGERFSEGASLLRISLRERGLKVSKNLKKASLLINWGVRSRNLPEGMLNSRLLRDKFNEAEYLREGGVATIETRKYLPRPVEGVEWLGRTLHHVAANDLLAGEALLRPDFFVKKENIVEEFRYHIFCGKSIRAGKKVVRDGFVSPTFVGDTPLPRAHPWIRSLDTGWRLSYGENPPKHLRVLAKKAVEVLGYAFGAVDIGVKADGRPLVLEVNSAPGMGDGTAEVWAAAIERKLAEDGQDV